MEDRFDFDDLKGNKLLPGLILVGVGVLALVGNFGLNLFGNVLGALLFGGLAYYLYSEGRRTGRAAMRFAALPVAGLALAALLPGRTGGALFLALIGLAFAVVWRADRRRWWAIIPAGTMASLAAVAGLGDLLGRADGFVFLGGLALTFYALTRLPVQPQAWAIWPAGGLGVLALMSLIVILTGAGVSAESGVDTFRDQGGIWSRYDLREVATPEGFAANPTPDFRLRFWEEHFTRGELAGLLQTAYRRFYFRPSVIWRNLRALDSWSELRHKAAAALALLAGRGDA